MPAEFPQAETNQPGNDIRNQVVSEICAASNENAADVSEFLRVYYDVRLRYLRDDPAAVAAFDAEELARAHARADRDA